MALKDHTRYFESLTVAPTPLEVRVPNTVSRNLKVGERSFLDVIGQAGKPLLDAEVNALREIQRALVWQDLPSGFLKPLDFVVETAPIGVAPGANVHADGTLLNAICLPKQTVWVAGNPLVLEYSNTDVDGVSLIPLSTPTIYDGTPGTAKTTDFVFLEVWKALVVASTPSTATVTVVSNPSITSGDQILINGVPLTAHTIAGVDRFVIGATVTDTATAIVNAVNDPLNSFSTFVRARSVAGVVTLEAVVPGTVGDLLTLSVVVASPGCITVSGAFFSGGVDTPNHPATEQGKLFRHGNTESDSATWVDDEIYDSDLALPTSARVQLQYRIRVEPVDEPQKTNPDGFSARSGATPLIFARGGRSVSVFAGNPAGDINSYPFVPANGSSTWLQSSAIGYGIEDSGLWVAGSGNERSAQDLGTVDGFVYAIPICFVFRHNDCSDVTAVVQGFDPVNNANGAPVYDHAGFVGVLGAIPPGVSDRPDGHFADVVTSDRLLDLRRTPVMKVTNRDSLKQFQHLLDGALGTWAVDTTSRQDLGGTGDVSTNYLICDEVGRTVAEAGAAPESGDTGRGRTIRNFDHIARRFASQGVIERVVFSFYPGDRPTLLAQGGPVAPGTVNLGKYAVKSELVGVPKSTSTWYEDDVLHVDLTTLDASTLSSLFQGLSGGGQSAVGHPDSTVANFMPPGTVISDVLSIYQDEGHYTNAVSQVCQVKQIVGIGTQHIEITLDANDRVVNGGDTLLPDYRMVGSDVAGVVTPTGSPRRIFVELEITYPIGYGLTDLPTELSPDSSVYDGSSVAGPGPIVATSVSQRPADFEAILPPGFRQGFQEVCLSYVANDTDSLLGGGTGAPVGSLNTETIVSINNASLRFPRRVWCESAGPFAASVTVTDMVGVSTPLVDEATSEFGSSSRLINLDTLGGTVLSGAGQTLCSIEYFPQDPIPNYGVSGYQVGVYYRSVSPQTAGVKEGVIHTGGGGVVPISLEVEPLTEGSVWSIQRGAASSEEGYPYLAPMAHLPFNDGFGGITGGWFFCGSANISLDGFDTETGLLSLPSLVPVDLQGSIVFGGSDPSELPVKDFEFRSFYPEVDGTGYKPWAIAQPLSDMSRHRTALPFLARVRGEVEGADGGLLFRKGEVVLVVVSNFHVLSEQNVVAFDAYGRTAVAVYKTKGCLTLSGD